MNDRLATQLQETGECEVTDLFVSEIVELLTTLGIPLDAASVDGGYSGRTFLRVSVVSSAVPERSPDV